MANHRSLMSLKKLKYFPVKLKSKKQKKQIKTKINKNKKHLLLFINIQRTNPSLRLRPVNN